MEAVVATAAGALRAAGTGGDRIGSEAISGSTTCGAGRGLARRPLSIENAPAGMRALLVPMDADAVLSAGAGAGVGPAFALPRSSLAGQPPVPPSVVDAGRAEEATATELRFEVPETAATEVRLEAPTETEAGTGLEVTATELR